MVFTHIQKKIKKSDLSKQIDNDILKKLKAIQKLNISKKIHIFATIGAFIKASKFTNIVML